MAALSQSTIAIAEVGSAALLLIALSSFYRICRRMDLIEGAPSIGGWNSKKPFYPFEVFRAYRGYFPQSNLTLISWLSAIGAAAIQCVLQFQGHISFWLQALGFSVGIGILAVRFTAQRREPFFQ